MTPAPDPLPCPMTQESGNKDSYYARNRKNRLAYQKEYYWRNKEKILEKEREKKKVDDEYRERKRVYNEHYFDTHRVQIYEQRRRRGSKSALMYSKSRVKGSEGVQKSEPGSNAASN